MKIALHANYKIKPNKTSTTLSLTKHRKLQCRIKVVKTWFVGIPITKSGHFHKFMSISIICGYTHIFNCITICMKKTTNTKFYLLTFIYRLTYTFCFDRLWFAIKTPTKQLLTGLVT